LNTARKCVADQFNIGRRVERHRRGGRNPGRSERKTAMIVYDNNDIKRDTAALASRIFLYPEDDDAMLDLGWRVELYTKLYRTFCDLENKQVVKSQ
jgi:hypothetical protein